MLNIVIPMAGAGSRFAKAGWKDPKPLIPIHGVPMIDLVIHNIRPATSHKFIFIVQSDHLKRYNLERLLRNASGDCEIIVLNGITEGAACTTLEATRLIDNSDPLMIANSDQYVDIDINAYLASMGSRDGLVMTMAASDPKWSYAALDEEGHITRIAEKEVISTEATVGIYNFAKGSEYVEAAQEMIEANERVNGEFYVAPVYNRLIRKGKKYACYNIGEAGQGMYGLGTPDDLESFLNLDLSRKCTWNIKCK